MKKNLYKILFLLFYTFCNVLHASPLPEGVTVVIQPESGSIYDTFTLQLDINWEKHRKQPEISSNDDFEIIGKSQNSSTRIVNGNVSINMSYQFLLKPKISGKLSIPDIILYKDKNKYRLVGKTINVSNKAKVNNTVKNNERIIINLEANKLEAFKGEQLFIRTELLTQVSIEEVEVLENEFNESWIENIDQKPIYNKFLNGKNYKAAGIENIIFPNNSGKYILEPRKFRLAVIDKITRRSPSDYFDLDNFLGNYRRKNVIMESNNLEINIKELPNPIEPLFLPTDAIIPVGKTSLNSSLSTNKVKTGESITLKFTLESYGLINSIKDLEIKVPDYVKIYKDKPKTSKEVIGKKIKYTKSFSYSLVPSKAENFTIEDTKISYFNPETRQYEIASVPGEKVKVLKDKNSVIDNPIIPESNLKEIIKPKELKQPKSDLITFLKEVSKSISTGFGLLILSIVILIIFIFFIFLKFFRTKEIKAPNFDLTNAPSDLYKEFKSYIESKLNLNKSSLIDEIRLLAFRKYSEDIALKIISTLKELEETSYAKNNAELTDIKREIKELVRKL